MKTEILITSKAWLTPYLNGREAFEAGLGERDCPYEMYNEDGTVNRSNKGWRVRWLMGWLDAKDQLPVRFKVRENGKAKPSSD